MTAPQNSKLDFKERQFFVFGQLATAIYYDICKERNIITASASEVFPGNGSTNDSVLILKGHGNDGKEHTKIVDIYHNVTETALNKYISMPQEKLHNEYIALPDGAEAHNFISTLYVIRKYERNRAKYVHKNVDKPETSSDDE